MSLIECQYGEACLNAKRCYLCHDYSHLRLPKRKTGLRSKRPATASWEKREQSIADQLNDVPLTREAYRRAGSGNKWYAPGDIVDDVLLVEAKERNMRTARGEKTISIKKVWLEKIIEEAKSCNLYPGFVFAYKGDDNAYAVMEFNDLCEMVHEIKLLRETVQRLEGEIDDRND